MGVTSEYAWLPTLADWSTWRGSLPQAPSGVRCTGETAERRCVRSVLALVQDWHCAACLGYFPGAGGLVVDHEHRTDMIRGLLCTWCNVSEPGSRHPVFAAYRARPPSRPRVWFYGGYRKGEPPEVYSAATGPAIPPRSAAREVAHRQALAVGAELAIASLAVRAAGKDQGGRRELAASALRLLFGDRAITER